MAITPFVQCLLDLSISSSPWNVAPRVVGETAPHTRVILNERNGVERSEESPAGRLFTPRCSVQSDNVAHVSQLSSDVLCMSRLLW